MKGIYAIFAIMLVVLLVSGCASTPTNDVATNDDASVKDTTAPSKDMTPQQCEETINYQVLIDALPTEVNGYMADEPEGNMLTFTNPEDQETIKYSTASVSLQKDDASIDVTIMDTCYIQYLSMAWASFYEMEGTDGYLKKTTVSGSPGWHQYDKSSDSYSYTIIVKDRVIVTVQGDDGVADGDVDAVANAISYNTIASAAK